MEKDFALEEEYTTIYNPIFHLWEDSKGYKYVCKFNYEEKEKHFKTKDALIKHIKSMLQKFAKQHRLLPWKYTEIQDDVQYKEDFGFGIEYYHGLIQAFSMDDAPAYVRMGELVDEYLEMVK